jgi:hypothetical protein
MFHSLMSHPENKEKPGNSAPVEILRVKHWTGELIKNLSKEEGHTTVCSEARFVCFRSQHPGNSFELAHRLDIVSSCNGMIDAK